MLQPDFVSCMFLLSLLLKKLPPDAQNQLCEAGPECCLLLKVECLEKKQKTKMKQKPPQQT